MRILSILLVASLAGCGSSNGSSADAESDAGAPIDAGSDAGSNDAGTDAGAPSDAGADAGRPFDAGASFPDAGAGAISSGTLTISGEPDHGLGIFDPSAAWDPIADAGVLAYSAVAPDQAHVHTRIAISSDRGASWNFASEANTNAAWTIGTTDNSVCGATSCLGTAVHEVPSLIVDDTDSADRRFKLFTHSYFAKTSSNLHYEIGMINLATAASAAGPWTTTHLLGWNSSSGASSQGVAQNINTDAKLTGTAKCLALTEPGALVYQRSGATVIDLAVGCIFLADEIPNIEIQLLRSTDHGQSFSFVSTLLSRYDATALGSTETQVNAADLFFRDGQAWIFATPSGPALFPGGGAGTGYRGCLAIPIGDLDAGTVVRTNSGAPLVSASYLGGSEQFVGACTFRGELTGLGVAGDVLDTNSSAPFTMFDIR